MGAATLTDVSLLDAYETAWRILGEHPCNVLLEGAVTATDAVRRLLQPHLRQPIAWHWPHAPFNPPSGGTAALILRDAAGLSRYDQQQLLEWIGDGGSRTQIVSTAAGPLFDLVTRGLFDAALYYRLNVLLLRVGGPYCPGVPRDDRGGGDRRVDDAITIMPLPRI